MFYILFLVIKEKKIMKIRELNEKQRLEVIRLHHQNKSSRQIAKEFKFISFKGVQKTIKKYSKPS